MTCFKYITNMLNSELSTLEIRDKATNQKQQYATTDLLFLISLIGALSSYAFLMFCYLS